MPLKTIIIGDIIMAKSGRAFADRKKIEALTSAKHITVADCGTLFMADGSGYGADVTHSIPHPSDAGNGWWVKIIVATVKSSVTNVIAVA